MKLFPNAEGRRGFHKAVVMISFGLAALAPTRPALADNLSIAFGSAVSSPNNSQPYFGPNVYYVDATLTNTGGADAIIGGFSLGAAAYDGTPAPANIDNNVTFLDVTSDVPSYLFAGHSFDFSSMPTPATSIQGSGPSVANDSYDPFGQGAILSPSQTLGLGRFFFSYAGTLPGNFVPGLAFDNNNMIDTSLTSFSSASGDPSQTSGPITLQGNGTYSVNLPDASSTPEPATIALAVQAALIGGFIIMRRKRRANRARVG